MSRIWAPRPRRSAVDRKSVGRVAGFRSHSDAATRENVAMSDAPVADKPGLRERKKAKTRAAIQEHALRLFREQGYEATTVEQIADAAEVSPSTFFRYFGSKEDVVAYDAFDPIVIEALRRQPAELPPAAALRRAIEVSFSQLTAEQKDELMSRGRLLFSEPELRTAAISELVRSSQVMVEELAVRLGRSPDDFDLRVYVGALLGAVFGAFAPHIDDPQADWVALIDRAFAYLEKGMPL
jgi:AcrR family transcriptional regulator